MKTTRILFSAPMVKAILAGNKSVTRRVIKPPPIGSHALRGAWGWNGYISLTTSLLVEALLADCQYGGAGDRLCVGEAWRAPDLHDALTPAEMPRDVPIKFEADGCEVRGPSPTPYGRYRHGRFMPSYFSRISLVVKNISAEPLQAIAKKPADLIAEGMPGETHAERLQAFHDGINHLNGDATYEKNPWVYAIYFERTENR